MSSPPTSPPSCATPQQVVFLEDGELATITADRFRTFTQDELVHQQDGDRGQALRGRLQPRRHVHYLRKEIGDQPEAVRGTLRGHLDHRFATARLGGLELSARELRSIRRVKARDALRRGLAVGGDRRHARRRAGGSAQGRARARCRQRRDRPRHRQRHLPTAGPEVSVASTKAFTCTLTAFSLLALHLGDVELGSDHLEAGHLDHSYAITAHRAQGATVDRTFVLGGEELYREWGYTALSRHRQEARFYVAGGDLQHDRETPPPHDPLVDGLARLLKRTQAKELALESLPLAEREHLKHERLELREKLAGASPPDRRIHQEDRALDAATTQLRRALDLKKTLAERSEQLRRVDRRSRVELAAQLEQNQQQQRHHAAEIQQLLAACRSADLTDHNWVLAHGPEAERFLAVDEELHARDLAADRVTKHIENLDRDAFDRTLGRCARALDMDFGR